MSEDTRKPEKKTSELLAKEKEILNKEQEDLKKLENELNEINPVPEKVRKPKPQPKKGFIEKYNEEHNMPFEKTAGVICGILIFLGLVAWVSEKVNEEKRINELKKVKAASEMPVMSINDIIVIFNIKEPKWYEGDQYNARIEKLFENENVIKIKNIDKDIYVHISKETATLIKSLEDGYKLLDLKKVEDKLNQK